MSMETIELKIEDKSRSYAKIYASLIDEQYQRKRANASITALFAYAAYLKNTYNLNIQNSMTIYRNPALCEQFEVADFYVNNYHIDVRITNVYNAVLVPKIHYDNGIMPDFYAVIKVDSELKKAVFLGIIDTKTSNPEPCDYHYYKFDEKSFITNEEFLKIIKTEKHQKTNIKSHEYFKEFYLSFIDNEIGSQKKREILKHLFECSECRTEFCCFTGFEMVSCNAVKYPEILEDRTLDIIGARDINKEKYKDKEEIIYTKDSTKTQNDINSDKKDEDNSDLTFIDENSKNSDESYIENVDDIDDIDDISNNYNKDSILEELFNSEDEQKSEIKQMNEHELFENVPDGVELKPDDILLIEDDDFETNNREISIIEKDNSDFFTDDNGKKINSIIESNENANIQKVIIDYDDSGNPIYSYITSADAASSVSEIENIDSNDTFNDFKYKLSNEEKEDSEEDILNVDVEDLKKESETKEITAEQNGNEKDEEEQLSDLSLDINSSEIVLDNTETEEMNCVEDNKTQDSEIVVIEDEEEENEEMECIGVESVGSEPELENKDEIDEIKQDNEYSMCDVSMAGTTEGQKTELENEEPDIMDQMFVDGALEREAREQQAISYNILGSQVDSHIPEPDKSEIKEPEIPVNSGEKIEKEEEEQSSNKNELMQTNETELETQKEADENVEEKTVTDIEIRKNGSEEAKCNDDESAKYEIELENDEEGDKIKQEGKYSEKETDTAEKYEIKSEENDDDANDDELINALSAGEKNESIQMFDGYIESELSKSNDGENVQKFEEYKDDESEENDEDDDDDDDDDDEEEGDDDMSDEERKKSSSKNMIILLGIIGALIIASGMGTFLFFKVKNEQSTNAANGNINNNETALSISDNSIQKIQLKSDKSQQNTKLLTEKDLKKKETNDINKAITNALSQGENLVTLRGINWECDTNLYADEAFKNYLKILDNILKQNLKNNIMGVTEIPPVNSVSAGFEIDNNRNLLNVNITKTSGSEELDKIVLQSINETFEGEKSPILTDSPRKADKYLLRVVIKL